MSVTRTPGLSVSVYSVGGTSFIDDLENATLSVELSDEDARGIADEWAYAWLTGRAWTLESDVFVNSTAAIFAMAVNGTGQVDISFNTGANNYSGTGVITSSNHQTAKTALQKQKVTIKGQGALTLS